MSNSVLASLETYEKILNDSFSADDAQFDVIFKSMWARDIEATVDGKSSGYDEVYKSLTGLRSMVASAEVKVLSLFRDGNKYAERHLTQAVMKDGSRSRADAYVFGELDEDGRIRKFSEALILKND